MAKKGLVFITKSTFSGVTAVNVSGCFSATYTHYLIKRNLSGTTGVVSVAMRMRSGSTDDTGTNYRYQYYSASSTSVTGARVTGATLWADAYGYTETTTFGYSETWVSNPFDAARTTAWADSGATQTGNIGLQSYAFAHDLTTSYDGFTVALNGAGTMTGSISVFGLVTA